MKKIVSLVLCLLLIISTIVFGITTVSASTNDDFEYCSTKLDKSLLDNLLALESDNYIQVSLWLR